MSWNRCLIAIALMPLSIACRRPSPTPAGTADAAPSVRSRIDPIVPVASVRGLPEVPAPPAGSPTTADRVGLGQALFFDRRLSRDDFMACVDCHLPDHGWATDHPKDPNALGKVARRNAPTIANAAYATALTWDGRAPTIEAVTMIAWKNQLGGDPAKVSARLAGIPAYAEAFARAFGGPPTEERIASALGSFVRAQRSGDAPWDRFVAGDAKAIDARAVRGSELFKEKGCAQCHAGPLFTDGEYHAVGVGLELPVEARDHGRMDATKRPEDDGRFRTPSLRDVARTGPYFHDGSVASLDDAIRRMAAAPRALDPKLAEATLTDDEVGAIHAFLEALSGAYAVADRPKPIGDR